MGSKQILWLLILGLAPQALCLRLLRRLRVTPLRRLRDRAFRLAYETCFRSCSGYSVSSCADEFHLARSDSLRGVARDRWLRPLRYRTDLRSVDLSGHLWLDQRILRRHVVSEFLSAVVLLACLVTSPHGPVLIRRCIQARRRSAAHHHASGLLGRRVCSVRQKRIRGFRSSHCERDALFAR